MPNRHARRAAVRTPNQEGRRGTSLGLRRLARQQPLMVVGVGIALGMVLGALLPWGNIDEEFLGEQAGKLKDGALDLASESYEKVKSVAQSTYAAASEVVGVNKNGAGAGEDSLGRSSET
jgi:hypothetical protein